MWKLDRADCVLLIRQTAICAAAVFALATNPFGWEDTRSLWIALTFGLLNFGVYFACKVASLASLGAIVSPVLGLACWGSLLATTTGMESPFVAGLWLEVALSAVTFSPGGVALVTGGAICVLWAQPELAGSEVATLAVALHSALLVGLGVATIRFAHGPGALRTFSVGLFRELQGDLSMARVVLAVALLAAIATVPAELEVYAPLFEPSPGLAFRATLVLAILGKTLAALGIGVAVACLMALSQRNARWLFLGFAWTIGVLAWIRVDAHLYAVTSNHLLDYVVFLGDPDALVWAGRGLDPWTPIASSVFRTLCWVALALPVSWALLRIRGAGRVVALSWFLALLASLLLQRVSPEVRALRLLEVELPWTWSAGFDESADPSRFAEDRARAIYEKKGEPLYQVQRFDEFERGIQLQSTPHVLLLVIESLRADALTPDIMPNLWRFSERGARGERHYSGSNVSHLGWFSMLYARLPFSYRVYIDSGQPVLFAETFARAGYRNRLVAASHVTFGGLERFLGDSHFEVDLFHEEPLSWQRDPLVVERSMEILRDSQEPQFLVAYPMATHFPYLVPPEADNLDSARDDDLNGLDPDLRNQSKDLMRRYRNAAHYVDTLLAPWLDEIDLTRVLVVVTGDHGESLYDDGVLGHFSRLSEVQIRVPLIIAGPGVEADRVIAGPTSHVDLLPTVLRLLGASPDALAALPGRDLFAAQVAPAVVGVLDRRAPRQHPAQLLLLSGDARYAVKLPHEGRGLELTGPMKLDGLPASAWEDIDVEGFLGMFEAFLDQQR
ncbi:MAG: sulfatase [Myxococcales bacterium]|nr:sulfatase [Myxococcales bacterium]